MNYKTDNPIIRFICFSLDIQIEHHLFPNIPHSSLRKTQHVVRGYCEKNDIPYIEKPTIFPTNHFFENRTSILYDTNSRIVGSSATKNSSWFPFPNIISQT